MPTLLGLDTSTDRLVVALCTSEGTHGIDEAGGARASARIVPAAMELLSRCGVTLNEVDAIAFGRGPGAFTGLRTACSVAQGLSFGTNRPVLPVDSLMIVADDARVQTGVDAVWVVMDARMDEIYAASYMWREGRWQTVAPPALYELDALHARWNEDGQLPCVAGSAIEAFADRLRIGDAVRVTTARDRGGALLRMALTLWGDGAAVDAAQALPLYLRDKVALTTAEREALK